MDEQAPKFLYHYTSAAGLVGILRSRKLWASHARFLNDGQELRYGFDLIRQVLRETARSAEANVSMALEQLDRTLIEGSEATFYVACFCEKDDLLSQWRGYGHSSDGTGYSIGFYSESLRQIQGVALAKVIYDAAEQRDRVEQRVRLALESGAFTYPSECFWSLHWELQDLVIRLKHPSFVEEQEWRVVWDIPAWKPGMGPEDALQFRFTHKFIVPYMELDVPTEEGNWRQQVMKIASVRHGPTSEPVEAREGLQWLLWKLGYAQVAVTGSVSPLRV